uniref:Hypotheticial protein n=1 Tax=Schistosoma japonicum TaxID=6182 RepID=C7TXV7_SCHJA|nr:hypotheticial protein [Schistosoma japonicum]
MQYSSVNCLVTVSVIQLIVAYTNFISTVARENSSYPELCYEATNITHIPRTTQGPSVELCVKDKKPKVAPIDYDEY